MLLHELLNNNPYFKVDGTTDISITDLTSDSRRAGSGSLFVAIKGSRFDGHEYIEDVIKQGTKAIVIQNGREVPVTSGITLIRVESTRRALAILADRFYGSPTKQLKVIGVTGTNGKTTTTHLIHRILMDYGYMAGLVGTIHQLIGDKREEVNNTTPESLELQKAFRRMLDHGCTYAVMEVSSHAIDQGRIRGIRYQSAIFTNLTQDHLDYHQTMDEYKRVKGLFFAQLGNEYTDAFRPAILNVDDPASSYYASITAAPVITYGIDHPADVRASDIVVTADGLSFHLETWKGSAHVNLRLIGKFNVYNALAAIAATLAEGLPLESIIASLSRIHGVNGRFERIEEGQDYTVIVDYAHTPDSLENVLTTIKQFARARVICVVGCGGDRDRTKRPVMAQIAAKYSDHVIFTSDNPRTEDPLQILNDMLEGLKNDQENASYDMIIDRKEAIQKAIASAEKDDVILIAGKGHETYQIIGNTKIHFDDHEIAREAIRSNRRA